MGKPRRWLSGLLLAGLLLALRPGLSQADDSAVGAVGYGVVPLDNDQITMDAERVEVEIRADQSWVTCVFTFTNRGPATEVLMGFPQAAGRGDGRPEAPELLDFRAWVDGRPLPVTFRPQAEGSGADRYAGWHTFAVPFAAGQIRVVRNTYHGRLGFVGYDGRFFGYVLHTGASWAGAIGQIDVVVRWRAHEVGEIWSISPLGYRRGPDELRWHFTDLEPGEEDDIWLNFYPVLGPFQVGGEAASSGQTRSEQPSGLRTLLFADYDAATAWCSEGETAGAWLLWSAAGYAGRLTTTLGLGILPGLAGGDYRGHGRPKEVLVRLAHWKGGQLPYLEPSLDTFRHPPPQVEISEHRLHLADAPRWQFLRLEEPAAVLAFQVEVVSVYPGERYHDVAIAEVLFPVLEEDLAAPPILPRTGGSDDRKVFLLGLGLAGLVTGGAIRTWAKRRGP